MCHRKIITSQYSLILVKINLEGNIEPKNERPRSSVFLENLLYKSFVSFQNMKF